MNNGIRDFLPKKRTQYRPMMLEHYNELADKVKDHGEKAGEKWVIRDEFVLSNRRMGNTSVHTVIERGSNVDDDPKTKDVINIKKNMEDFGFSSTYRSTELTSYTRKEEKRMFGLRGKREVIIEKTEGFIFFDSKRYHKTSLVKIDAVTGKELKHVVKYPNNK